MEGYVNCLVESMCRYIGQTVTIFTTSGGLSGNGFTGVLAGFCDGSVKLITDIGAPPACPVGSACCGGFDPCGGGDFIDGPEIGGSCRGHGWCGGRCGCGGCGCATCEGPGRGRGMRGRCRRGMNWNWLGSPSYQKN